MKAAPSSSLDHGPITRWRPAFRLGRARAWLAAVMLGLAVVLLLAALPPRLADICGQDGGLVCGP